MLRAQCQRRRAGRAVWAWNGLSAWRMIRPGCSAVTSSSLGTFCCSWCSIIRATATTESLDQARGKLPGTETANPLIRKPAITPGRDRIHINRRDFIRELGALGLAPWAAAASLAQGAAVPLQLLAAEKGLLFGSCLALKYFVQAPAYQQLFL